MLSQAEINALLGGKAETNSIQQETINALNLRLNSYFNGTLTKDSIMVFEANGTTYIVQIEKFVPAAEQIKQHADAAGIQIKD